MMKHDHDAFVRDITNKCSKLEQVTENVDKAIKSLIVPTVNNNESQKVTTNEKQVPDQKIKESPKEVLYVTSSIGSNTDIEFLEKTLEARIT